MPFAQYLELPAVQVALWVAAPIVGVFLMFFFLVWLPHNLHIWKLGRRYGRPAVKRQAIEALLREGKLTSIGYAHLGSLKYGLFALVLRGPFGVFTRMGKTNNLETQPGSNDLPPEVAEAFRGYIDHPADVMHLLWYEPFLRRVQEIEGLIVGFHPTIPNALGIGPGAQ